ncbi:MAG: hypothetical protein ABSA47_06135 [Verrucomicrobiota bacterium]|jgi:hypothetical protein
MLVLVLGIPTLAGGQPAKRTSFAFATIEQGGKLLTEHDDFVSRLSPFDRAARMKTNQDVSEQDYLSFVARNVLDWDSDGQVLVQSALSDLQPRLDGLGLPFPETVYFVKTTGAEEGGAGYTRGAAIVLPRPMLDEKNRKFLREIIAHELFHVLSRRNPQLKEQLYAAIGFQPCGEIVFPAALVEAKITNPDAPKNDHCISLKIGNESVWAAPILYSPAARYDTNRGGEFFQYLRMQFLVVERNGGGTDAKAIYDPTHPRLVSPDQVSGFYEQVGRNTDYIIHPEEILADNFKLFLLQQTNVPSPQILQKLGEALAGYKSH